MLAFMCLQQKTIYCYSADRKVKFYKCNTLNLAVVLSLPLESKVIHTGH